MTRAEMSVPPPGANGTSMRMGRAGYGCCAWDDAVSAMRSAHVQRLSKRGCNGRVLLDLFASFAVDYMKLLGGRGCEGVRPSTSLARSLS